MEEVCEVGPKNLRENIRVEELFLARSVSRYFPLQKKSSYVNTETRKFYAIIVNILLVCLYDQDVFFVFFFGCF